MTISKRKDDRYLAKSKLYKLVKLMKETRVEIKKLKVDEKGEENNKLRIQKLNIRIRVVEGLLSKGGIDLLLDKYVKRKTKLVLQRSNGCLTKEQAHNVAFGERTEKELTLELIDKLSKKENK